MIHRIPINDWGACLLGQLVKLLFGIRLAVDRVVRGNVQFSPVVNTICGGLCGLLSGLLTIGITIVGIGFLPLGTSLLGYRPLAVDPDGTVVLNEDGQLLLPADRWAIRFFERLSGGSFFSGRQLAQHMPDLHLQHALYRMPVDPYSRLSARPDFVTFAEDEYSVRDLNTLEIQDAALRAALTDPSATTPQKLVMAEVDFSFGAPPYDNDSILRISPTHVRLMTDASRGRSDLDTHQHAPKAFVFVSDKGDRTFYPFEKRETSADSTRQAQRLGWVFVVPDDQRPTFLLVRRLRFELPDESQSLQDKEEIVRRLGNSQVVKVAVGPGEGGDGPRGPSGIDEREGTVVGSRPFKIELTAKLPTHISKEKARLQYQGSAIVSGYHERVKRTNYRPKQQNRVDRILVQPGQQAVRMQLTPENANSLLGRSIELAAELGVVSVRDSGGVEYQARGYVWKHAGRGDQTIWFRPGGIRAAKDLPSSQMKKGDELFIYFVLPVNIDLVQYRVGHTKWPINPPLQVR